MATKILVFDPLSPEERQNAETELDRLFVDQWQLVSSVSGNRAGVRVGVGVQSSVSSAHPPEHKDYVVLILHKP